MATLDYGLVKGSFTAVITPFAKNLGMDYEGFEKLLGFQKRYGNKCVIMGTTAESPAVSWDEHIKSIKIALDALGPDYVVAGTGSNSTLEALKATKKAYDLEAKAALLVDCYYNKPASKSLHDNYYSIVAEKVPELLIIPYVIPGRSVTQLSVPHLINLAENFPNINSVKEASGDLARMKLTRKIANLEGLKDFSILSGDDNLTYSMMSDELIKANGVISVYSNIFPKAVNDMVKFLQEKNYEKAEKINNDLNPLFELVGLKNNQELKLNYGTYIVENKYPNPMPVKALMNILGMPSGPCRSPLGKIDAQSLIQVKNAALKVYEKGAEYFEPLEEYFGIKDVKDKLSQNT